MTLKYVRYIAVIIMSGQQPVSKHKGLLQLTTNRNYTTNKKRVKCVNRHTENRQRSTVSDSDTMLSSSRKMDTQYMHCHCTQWRTCSLRCDINK